MFLLNYPLDLSCNWFMFYYLTMFNSQTVVCWIMLVFCIIHSISFFVVIREIWMYRKYHDGMCMLWFINVGTIACFVYIAFDIRNALNWSLYVKAVKALLLSFAKCIHNCKSRRDNNSIDEETRCEETCSYLGYIVLLGCGIAILVISS